MFFFESASALFNHKFIFENFLLFLNLFFLFIVNLDYFFCFDFFSAYL